MTIIFIVVVAIPVIISIVANTFKSLISFITTPVVSVIAASVITINSIVTTPVNLVSFAIISVTVVFSAGTITYRSLNGPVPAMCISVSVLTMIIVWRVSAIIPHDNLVAVV